MTSGRARFQRKIKGAAQAERVFDAPVLAQLANIDVRRRSISDVSSDSGNAAGFRRLRDNLGELAESGARALFVSSAGRYQGRAMVIGGAAVGAADAGRRAVAIELDGNRSDLARIFSGVRLDRALADFVLAADPRAELRAALAPVTRSLVFVPRGVATTRLDGAAREQLAALIDELRGRFDHVLASGPPPLESPESLELAAHFDGVLLVARHEHTTVREAEETRELLERAGTAVVGIVLTGTGDLADSSLLPAELRAHRAPAARRPAPAPAPVVSAPPVPEPKVAPKPAPKAAPQPVATPRPAPRIPPRPEPKPAPQPVARPRPAPPRPAPPIPAAQPVALDQRSLDRRSFARLEQIASGLSETDPLRARELGHYLHALRGLVDGEGYLPPWVDDIVVRSFGELVSH